MDAHVHLRTILSAVAIAAAVLPCASRSARAEEERRVVVAEFEGPSAAASQARKAILDIIADFYEVLPVAKYRVARRRLEITRDSMQTVAKLARKVGVDAIVEGELKKRELTLSVREGKSGRVVDRFKVAVQGRGFSDATRERIVDELVDLIDWTEPLERGGEDVDRKAEQALEAGDPAAGPVPRVSLAAAEKKPAPVAKKWAVEDGPTEVEAKARKAADRRPPARPPASSPSPIRSISPRTGGRSACPAAPRPASPSPAASTSLPSGSRPT
jgi:hypothetical protein